eukprot:SAG31_NODE_1164_length_9581_cov_16.106623_1_plen_61_part_00
MAAGCILKYGIFFKKSTTKSCCQLNLNLVHVDSDGEFVIVQILAPWRMGMYPDTDQTKFR